MSSSQTAPQQAPAHRSESLRVFRDSVANSAGFLISSLASLIVIPLMLRVLDDGLYGLWIATFALAETAAFFNSGISRGVALEISRRIHTADKDVSGFISAAGMAFLCLGVAGAAYIYVAGLGLAHALHLDSASHSIAPQLIGLLAISFIGEQISVYATQLLTGLRRFVLINSLRVAGIPLRIGGLIALLLARSNIATLASWYALSTFVIAGVNVSVVWSIRPQWFSNVTRPDWRALRRQLGFSTLSQIADFIGGLVAQAPAFLIGSVRDSGAIVPFYVGQRVPAALEVAAWRASHVIFPASSEFHAKGSAVQGLRVLKSATRSMVTLFYPITIVMWFLGPAILKVWLRSELTPESIAVFRVLLIWNLVAAVSANAVQVLWGHGRARAVLKLIVVSGAFNLALSYVLLKYVGLIGPAVGIVVGELILGSCAVRLAAHDYGTSVVDLLRAAYERLGLPLVAVGVAAAILQRIANSWLGIIISFALCLSVFGGLFYLRSPHRQRRAELAADLRSLLRLPRQGGEG